MDTKFRRKYFFSHQKYLHKPNKSKHTQERGEPFFWLTLYYILENILPWSQLSDKKGFFNNEKSKIKKIINESIKTKVQLFTMVFCLSLKGKCLQPEIVKVGCWWNQIRQVVESTGVLNNNHQTYFLIFFLSKKNKHWRSCWSTSGT